MVFLKILYSEKRFFGIEALKSGFDLGLPPQPNMGKCFLLSIESLTGRQEKLSNNWEHFQRIRIL